MGKSDVNVMAQFDWTDVGVVRLDEAAKLVFPDLPTAPGLYRFRCASDTSPWQYIGETDNLRRRAYHYRNPGPSQWTNIRLNDLLRGEIVNGNEVAFATATEATIEVADVWADADLRQKAVRRSLENAALIAATEAGERIHNL